MWQVPNDKGRVADGDLSRPVRRFLSDFDFPGAFSSFLM
jgi:hypothetical protein